MPTVPSPQTILDRVRRDVERNALRARNGIKLVSGVDRPGVGLTPKDVVWQRGRCQLWHYRNDNVRYGPPLQAWRERRAIGRRAKISALLALFASVVIVELTLGWPWVLIPAAVAAVSGTWIWTRAE